MIKKVFLSVADLGNFSSIASFLTTLVIQVYPTCKTRLKKMFVLIGGFLMTACTLLAGYDSALRG